MIYPTAVPELNEMTLVDRGLMVGGAVTLSELQKKLTALVDTLPGK